MAGWRIGAERFAGTDEDRSGVPATGADDALVHGQLSLAQPDLFVLDTQPGRLDLTLGVDGLQGGQFTFDARPPRLFASSPRPFADRRRCPPRPFCSTS